MYKSGIAVERGLSVCLSSVIASKWLYLSLNFFHAL